MSGSESQNANPRSFFARHHHHYTHYSPDPLVDHYDYNYSNPVEYSLPDSPFAVPDAYFDDAFAAGASPTPPPSRFLDNILNPADPDYLPFGYRRPPSPSRRRHFSPYLSNSAVPTMPPSRAARLPNGYVDLTNEPDETPRRRVKRESPSPGPSSKRLKRNDGNVARRTAQSPPAKIEEIDLSDDKPAVQDVLQKQRADAVKAQQKPEETATTFKNINCVICMDTPTDLTATACGHLFCHTCLMEALIAGENRSAPNEPKRSQCPVCRKFINRTKDKEVIPLMLMKGLATQPRKPSTAKVT
ncbi:hypothetical protein EJ04DRAFT_425554 [Polyplosphaeria fusca]|uniref:RING-type domain-containing protein n=1 Tax=Polyplosphaeria fusca TaxID=682080 RepID=A0A9P4R735_9PLEO|nr:hypothetical protein EJ04DRAFT_425554 [Polyplosphaeria fusca]